MKRSLLVLLALSVFGMLLACDAATTLLSNPTPVVVVVTPTPPAGAPQAQATTAPPVAPAAANADPIAGVWSGAAKNGDLNFQITVTVAKSCTIGSVCGPFNVPAFPCSGTFTLVGVSGTTYQFQTGDLKGTCTAGAAESLQLLPDGTLLYTSRHSSYGESKGILQRTGDAAATSPQPTSAPAGNATPAANVPPPKTGTGSVIGRVLWNSKGVGNVDVKLCEDFQLISGCKGKEFTTQTDASGAYTFANVTPGEYALAVQPFEKGTWLYITTGLGIGSRKYTVAADKVLNVGDQHVFKNDLQLSKPPDDSQVNTAQPTMVWDAYPSAAYYEVYLTPENGETVYIHKRVNTNQLTVENPLKTCKYTWDVAAFNDQGIKIADKSKYFDFFVTGQPMSCYIQITSPASKATVSGTGVKLVWEAHPQASYYKIHMWKDETGSPKILDFLQVRETSYTFSDALKPGKYVWAAYAYDQFGKTVAGSGISYIVVQ